MSWLRTTALAFLIACGPATATTPVPSPPPATATTPPANTAEPPGTPETTTPTTPPPPTTQGPPPAGDPMGAGSAAGSGSAVGASCGSRGQAACPANEFCNYAPGEQCGAADQPGHCAAKPRMCPRIYNPVCGCDHKTYPNSCDAASRGVGVLSTGKC